MRNRGSWSNRYWKYVVPERGKPVRKIGDPSGDASTSG
jgi:hypothetical protein